MENNKKDITLDYDEFYTLFKDENYMPLRIDYDWLLENENYLRENLYSFYLIYTNHKNPSEIIKSLFRLYADVTLNTYMHFEGRGHYL